MGNAWQPMQTMFYGVKSYPLIYFVWRRACCTTLSTLKVKIQANVICNAFTYLAMFPGRVLFLSSNLPQKEFEHFHFFVFCLNTTYVHPSSKTSHFFSPVRNILSLPRSQRPWPKLLKSSIFIEIDIQNGKQVQGQASKKLRVYRIWYPQ